MLEDWAALSGIGYLGILFVWDASVYWQQKQTGPLPILSWRQCQKKTGRHSEIPGSDFAVGTSYTIEVILEVGLEEGDYFILLSFDIA